MKSMQSDRE